MASLSATGTVNITDDEQMNNHLDKGVCRDPRTAGVLR